MIDLRVANGAKFLDDARPGWRNKINLDKLDLSDATECILGQVYGRYYDGNRILDISHALCESYGFTAKDDRWEELTEAWKRYLLPEVYGPRYADGTLLIHDGTEVCKILSSLLLDGEWIYTMHLGKSKTEFEPAKSFWVRTESTLVRSWKVFTPLPEVKAGDILKSKDGDMFIVVEVTGHGVVYRITGPTENRTWDNLASWAKTHGPLEIVTNNAHTPISELLDR